MLRLLIALAVLAISPLLAKEGFIKESVMQGQVYSHGTLRQAERALEAVVEVAAELAPNVRAGQQVRMEVRQGQLRGTVKGMRSPVEITIALDASRSKVKLSRLQPGQAVIAVIQLEPDCNCELPEMR